MTNDLIAGIDGGGTKTECLVSDFKGNIVGKGLAGPSNPRNQGMEETAKNVAESLRKALGRRKGIVSSVFVGLAAAEEEYSGKLSLIRKELSKDDRVRKIFFGSDQEAAFRSGTDEHDGIVAIAGTGSVVRGWKGRRGVKVGGWGYLADEGSAFWIGQRAYQVIAKELDGRGERTLVTKLAGVKDMEGLNGKVYGDPLRFIPSLSIAVDEAAGKGDHVARSILDEATDEIVFGVLTVSARLGFENEFPLIASGGMFRSGTFKEFFEEKVKNKTPLARFIVPAESPAFGSLKLAIEMIHEKKSERS